jgi:hypothetical protein
VLPAARRLAPGDIDREERGGGARTREVEKEEERKIGKGKKKGNEKGNKEEEKK